MVEGVWLNTFISARLACYKCSIVLSSGFNWLNFYNVIPSFISPMQSFPLVSHTKATYSRQTDTRIIKKGEDPALRREYPPSSLAFDHLNQVVNVQILTRIKMQPIVFDVFREVKVILAMFEKNSKRQFLLRN